MNPKKNEDHILRPYSFKDLRALYGVSHKTMKKWLDPFLKEIGEHKTRLFTIKQVKIIFQKIGAPDGFEFED